VDIIDKGILAQLASNCRITYEELSRKFGITANAIKRRVQKLEENGVIAGYSITLRPAMINANALFGLIKSNGSIDEREYVNTIGQNPFVVAAAAYTDGNYALIAEYITSVDLASIGSFLRGLDGVESVEFHTFLGNPGKKMNLSKLHLQVISPLIKDARMSIVEIVKETGFSARRVRRALNELINGEGIRFTALLELGAANSLPFLVKCTYDERQIIPSEIHQKLESSYTLPFWEIYISATEPVFFCLMAVDNLTELEEVVRSLRRETFIKSAQALIGIYHDYFEGPRTRELKTMLLEGGFADKLPKIQPLNEP